MSSYSPGQAADKAGFSLDTLRYYERVGLLRTVSMSGSFPRQRPSSDSAHRQANAQDPLGRQRTEAIRS
jgi:MerR HTH family regulatory protein